MGNQEDAEAKIGAGHMSAMARLGLKELRQAAYFENSNIAQPGELGLYGSITPGEVAASRQSEGREIEPEEEKSSVLADRLRQAESRDDRGKEDRELER